MLFLVIFILLLTLVPFFKFMHGKRNKVVYHQNIQNNQNFQSFHSALEDYGQVHNDVQVASMGGELTGLKLWLGLKADSKQETEGVDSDPFSETAEDTLDNSSYTAILKINILQQRHDKSFRSVLTKPIVIDSSYFESSENSLSFDHLLIPGRIVLPGAVILIQRKYLSKTHNTPNLLSFKTTL